MDPISRELCPVLEQALQKKGLTGLMGPRRSGKTFLARNLLRHENLIRYVDLKDPEVRGRLMGGAHQEFRVPDDQLIVIDEIERMPDLIPVLGELDRPVLAIGSSHLLLDPRIKGSIAGKAGLFTLPPLSFHERSGRTEDTYFRRLIRLGSPAEIEAFLHQTYLSTGESERLSRLFADFLLFGGYPELLDLSLARDRTAWLKALRRSYLDVDIREMVNLRSRDSFERFEERFALGAGIVINMSELARNCGLSIDTARRFLDFLRRLFLAWPLRPLPLQTSKRMMKTPIWYFTDAALARTIPSPFHPRGETFFTNTVLSELRKSRYFETGVDALFHARTSTGVAADAVFRNKRGNILFFCAVKTGARAHRTDLRHLKKYRALCPESIGLVINESDTAENLDERIWQVPAHWLLA